MCTLSMEVEREARKKGNLVGCVDRSPVSQQHARQLHVAIRCCAVERGLAILQARQVARVRNRTSLRALMSAPSRISARLSSLAPFSAAICRRELPWSSTTGGASKAALEPAENDIFRQFS